MKYLLILTASLFFASFNTNAEENVEMTGTYQVRIGCHGTFHEETSFIAEPGKDKFSAKMHAVSLTPDQKNKLRIGMKIKIKGKKKAAAKKMMTKGQVRKAMYNYLKRSEGMPLNCKGMGDIISKITVQSNKSENAHDHGEIKLKKVDDDDDEVEVSFPAHIEVEAIEILK